MSHILDAGLCTKHHKNASPNFIPIGNKEIIGVRDDTLVKIPGYGKIGDYVPFYFTPKSIMQFNIVSGHWAPAIPKQPQENILIIQCLISALSNLPRFFFTNGQANTSITKHYTDMADLDKIDWECIQHGNFSKADGDFDRPRRYQAEFLVHNHVPVQSINALFVYNDKAANFVNEEIAKSGSNTLKVHVESRCFF